MLRCILQNKYLGSRILFLLPSMLGVCCFLALPFADVVRRSFTTAMSEEFVGLKNYIRIFQNDAFLLALRNTVRFTVICIPILILLGLAIALLLAETRHAPLLKSIFLFPMAMPAATIILVWEMVFSDKGLLNGWTGWEIDYMETGYAFWVLVFSYVWKNLGYTVVLWLTGLMGIPKELLEAASMDGAGKFRILCYIILPCLKGVLYTITVLSFLNSFKVFREAWLVAGSYPHESMYLLQHLFNNWFTRLELEKMAAAAVCIAVFLFLIIEVLQYLWEAEE